MLNLTNWLAARDKEVTVLTANASTLQDQVTVLTASYKAACEEKAMVDGQLTEVGTLAASIANYGLCSIILNRSPSV